MSHKSNYRTKWFKKRPFSPSFPQKAAYFPKFSSLNLAAVCAAGLYSIIAFIFFFITQYYKIQFHEINPSNNSFCSSSLPRSGMTQAFFCFELLSAEFLRNNRTLDAEEYSQLYTGHHLQNVTMYLCSLYLIFVIALSDSFLLILDPESCRDMVS